MAKYGKKAQELVESALHREKKGSLKSGRSGKKVKSREQAIAIGLSEARKKGAKVPPPKKAADSKSATKTKSATKAKKSKKASTKKATTKNPR